MFGIRKFDKYVYGRRFTIYADHKPLTKLFGPATATLTTVAARIQRWSLFLGNYNYDIVRKSGSSDLNADELSRLPLPHTAELDSDVLQVYDEVICKVPLEASRIAAEMRRDHVLSLVLSLLNDGWPEFVKPAELQPLATRKQSWCSTVECFSGDCVP